MYAGRGDKFPIKIRTFHLTNYIELYRPLSIITIDQNVNRRQALNKENFNSKEIRTFIPSVDLFLKTVTRNQKDTPYTVHST